MESWSPRTKLRVGLCTLDDEGRIVSVWNFGDWGEELDSIEDPQPIEPLPVGNVISDVGWEFLAESQVDNGHTHDDNTVSEVAIEREDSSWFDPLGIIYGVDSELSGGIIYYPVRLRLNRMYNSDLSERLMDWNSRSVIPSDSTMAPTAGNEIAMTEEDYDDLPSLEGPDQWQLEYDGLPDLEHVQYVHVTGEGNLALCPICESRSSLHAHGAADLRLSGMWACYIDAATVLLMIRALCCIFAFPEKNIAGLLHFVLEVYLASVAGNMV